MNKCDKDGLFITDTHVFFWKGVFSNFHRTNFKYSAFNEEQEFFCTEQAFMWYKAMYFNDLEIADNILEERGDPFICKQFGRKVKNYNDDAWNKVRYDVMREVNIAKFSQDAKLNEFIKDPRFDGKTFVEASPYDRIWGIKMGIECPTIDDESTWKGQNLLGKVITEVRSILISLAEGDLK